MLPHAVVVLLVFAYYLSLWDSIIEFALFMDVAPVFLGDFHYVYGPTGSNIFTTKMPTWGFFYSSFAAILLGLLHLLPWPLKAWGALQVLFTLALWLLPFRFIFREKMHALAWTALFFLSVPILHNFSWGQVSTLLLLLPVMGFLLYERGRWPSASACFALAISIKFYPVVFLLYFLLKRDWKTLGATAALTFLFLVVVPAGVLGPRTSLEFIRQVQQSVADNRPSIVANPNSQYFPSVMQRLANIDPEQNSEQRAALSLLGIAIFIAIGGIVVLAWRKNMAHLQWWILILLSLGFPFVMMTSWPHYFVVLPFAQVFLLAAVALSSMSPGGKIANVALLLFPSMVMATIPFRHMIVLLTAPENGLEAVLAYSNPGYLFWSNLLLLIAAVILVITHKNKKRAALEAPPAV